MIKKRRDNGKLIILSCYDSSLIEELADKIYYMKAGELIWNTVFNLIVMKT